MTLSEFSLRIILIFLPGLIAFIIVEQLTSHKEIQPFRLLLHSFLLGFLCYLIYYPISLISFLNLKFSFIQNLSDPKLSLNFWEILIATLISIPFGFIISFSIKKKVLHKIAERLHVTNKFGDLDVWSYIMNSEIPEWVVIRDIENDLMYEGYIKAFSDSSEIDELFLIYVKVYTNKTAEKLYEVPGLYLPQKREKLVIEFPELKNTTNIKKENDK
jgi:hypothetical protein